MRRMMTAVAAAALAGLAVQASTSVAQPEERRGEWRGDRMPDARWDERDDFERRGRTDIECPLTQVRREITSELPEGWWNTPLVENLSGTEVQTIGGRRTLVCKYGPAGQIMRLEPRRRDCTPTRRGFDCRRERFPNPGPFPPGGPGGPGRPGRPGDVLVSESVELRPSFQVDLDTGRIGSGVGDLWYHAVSPGEAYLEPVNGARLSWAPRRAGDFGECRDAQFRTYRIPISRLGDGAGMCFRTDAGRVGYLTTDRFVGAERRLRITFTTWVTR